jgi:hypothetical protein
MTLEKSTVMGGQTMTGRGQISACILHILDLLIGQPQKVGDQYIDSGATLENLLIDTQAAAVHRNNPVQGRFEFNVEADERPASPVVATNRKLRSSIIQKSSVFVWNRNGGSFRLSYR